MAVLAYPTRNYLVKTCKNLEVSITDVGDRNNKQSWRPVNRSKDQDKAPDEKVIFNIRLIAAKNFKIMTL